MMKKLELIGNRYGKLLVIERDSLTNEPTKWTCVCDCGKIVSVYQGNLVRGLSKSCGCQQYPGKHHLWGTRVYFIWNSMKQRCKNKNNAHYKEYGGRGITVCDRWELFNNFYEDMGDCPPLMTIERIDNNKGYYKENCKWATRKEQMWNTRATKHIEANGVIKTYREWQKITGLTMEAIRGRLRRGWDPNNFLIIN